jgi:flavin reductase (DIM6/NTAB) family NADH-FMN oxidoreductase RutF
MPNTALPPAVTETLAMLSSPMLLITTHAQGRSNGLVARSGVFASLVPEAPRVLSRGAERRRGTGGRPG